jgi:flagellar biosynthesis component FlhA
VLCLSTILVIVNFVVITKGSGRIAEVAARFHLDSMPGKQGLGFAEAAHAYTLLTVGDGLVTQVPALIVSIVAGLLVSNTAH